MKIPVPIRRDYKSVGEALMWYFNDYPGLWVEGTSADIWLRFKDVKDPWSDPEFIRELEVHHCVKNL